MTYAGKPYEGNKHEETDNLRKILIAEDTSVLSSGIEVYLAHPKRAGVYNFPYELKVSNVNPASDLTTNKLKCRSIDLVVTDIASSYIHVLREAQKINIPALVVARYEDREIKNAVEKGGIAFYLGKGCEILFMETIRNILSGANTESKIGFERLPIRKTEPSLNLGRDINTKRYLRGYKGMKHVSTKRPSN
ncbi:MAG: hypothetical protein Q8O89_00480 [Nanoarchaeota archaeon]|nr:hypothetical protein [Nanoarchaeota archaeon]